MPCAAWGLPQTLLLAMTTLSASFTTHQQAQDSIPEARMEYPPSLEAFKARLDVALGSPVWWLTVLHIAGGLKLHDHYGPFQPKPFYDTTI